MGVQPYRMDPEVEELLVQLADASMTVPRPERRFFRFEFEDVLDAGGDRVFLLFHLHGRGKDSGAVFEERPAWVQTIRDGKVVRIDAFLDRGEAPEAVGLSERLA